MKRLAFAGVGVLIAVPLSLVVAPTFPAAGAPGGGGTQDVRVTNFPATQPVSGTVNVGNLPSTQTVNGTVGATQSGAWNVSVGNLPATQTVDGTVNVGNSPTVKLDPANNAVTPVTETKTLYESPYEGVPLPSTAGSGNVFSLPGSAAYRTVRVYAFTQCTSPGPVTISLNTYITSGSTWTVESMTVNPCDSGTFVAEVPGVNNHVTATSTVSGTGNAVSLAVFGRN